MSSNSLDNWQQMIGDWARERGIIEQSTPLKQLAKTREEIEEVNAASRRGHSDDVRMELGDVFVTLLVLAEKLGVRMQDAIKASAIYTVSNRSSLYWEDIVTHVDYLHNGLSSGDKYHLYFLGNIFRCTMAKCRSCDITPEDCLMLAYRKISQRDGKMVDGWFVRSH